MKRLTLSVLTLMTASVAMARQLNPDEALSAALQELSTAQCLTNAHRAASRGASSMKLTFTQRSEQQKPLFYVYDLAGGGYVIAAADDRAHSLLGYTDEGSFQDEAQNPGFAQWQQQCAEAMEWLSRQPEWPAMAQQREAEVLTPVAPLLGDIMWSQRYPYNAMCPYRTNAEGEQVHALTGCVATATAQLMMYHQWPQSGTGSHTNVNDPSQTVDFSQSTYDWTSLKATYTGQESAEEAAPIAKLMYDIGCAENTKYNATESFSRNTLAMYALATYFKYDKGITYLKREYYTTEEWNKALRGELCQQRPILFGAHTSEDEGHTFVIDGYDENGLYHVNWGWGGHQNGYFDMNYLDPDMQGAGNGSYGSFNLYQDAIVNIRKDETGTSQAQYILQVKDPLIYYMDYEDHGELMYSFRNYGMGDFNGYVGIQLQNQEGEIVDEYRNDYSEDPVSFAEGDMIFYYIPEELQGTEGLIARPIYGEGETVFYMDSYPLSFANYLVSYDTGNGIGWTVRRGDEPTLLLKDWEVLRNYAGYAPKIQLTIANLTPSRGEFNEAIEVYIANEEDYLWLGRTQLFLRPGETKTIEVICEIALTDLGTDFEAGDYGFLPIYNRGIIDNYLLYGPEMSVFKGEDFTMVENAPSDIAYSDFAIDKPVVEQGDTLTVSFTADNTGGYAQKDYVFRIFREGGNEQCGNINTLRNDIAPYSQTLISFSGTIDLAPGNYYCKLFDYTAKTYASEQCLCLTVTGKMDPTIAVTPLADTDSQCAALYDLFGRRIGSAARHGIYVAGGKKIIK